MNDFREFSNAYNDYLCHGQGTGSSMKYGSKEYRKSGRRVYGSEAANMRPKDYIAKCVRQGMTNEEIIKQCETALDPGYNPTTDEKHFFMEVIRLIKNDMQHSYNDFRGLHEDYIMHHGIKGMRWGIRRFQNPDGTLTDEGKRRYNLSDEKAYGEYKSKEKQIREKADAGAMVGALGSLMGSGAALLPAAAVISGPAILAVPAIGMAGMYASVIISEKIGDKKVDDLKKSYNKERIEKSEKIVKNFSDMRVDAISKELKNRGMNLDTSGKKAISNALTYKIAEQLNDGIVTFNDIKKSDPKVGLTTNEQRAAVRAVRSASNLQNQMRLAQEQAIRSQQEFMRQVEMNNQIEMQNQLAYNQMQMMIPH